MPWKGDPEPNIKYCLGREVLLVQEVITVQNFGQLMVSQWNLSGIFQAFTTLQFCNKVQESLSRLRITPEKFAGRIIFMSMFNDIS